MARGLRAIEHLCSRRVKISRAQRDDHVDCEERVDDVSEREHRVKVAVLVEEGDGKRRLGRRVESEDAHEGEPQPIPPVVRIDHHLHIVLLVVG